MIGGKNNISDLKRKKWMILNLPDTPTHVISRSWAGTFGTAELKSQQEVRRFLPIWMLYAVSTLLNEQVLFQVVDAQADNLGNDQTLAKIISDKPDVILTLICLPSYNNDCSLIKKIKKSCPETMVLILGGLVYINPEKILDQSNADVILQGRFPFYNSIKAFLLKDIHAGGIIFKKQGTFSYKNGRESSL